MSKKNNKKSTTRKSTLSTSSTKKKVSSGYVSRRIPYGMTKIGVGSDGVEVYSATPQVMSLYYPDLYALAPGRPGYVFTGSNGVYTPIGQSNHAYDEIILNNPIVVKTVTQKNKPIDQSNVEVSTYGNGPVTNPYNVNDLFLLERFNLLFWNDGGRDIWLKLADERAKALTPGFWDFMNIYTTPFKIVSPTNWYGTLFKLIYDPSGARLASDFLGGQNSGLFETTRGMNLWALAHPFASSLINTGTDVALLGRFAFPSTFGRVSSGITRGLNAFGRAITPSAYFRAGLPFANVAARAGVNPALAGTVANTILTVPAGLTAANAINTWNNPNSSTTDKFVDTADAVLWNLPLTEAYWRGVKTGYNAVRGLGSRIGTWPTTRGNVFGMRFGDNAWGFSVPENVMRITPTSGSPITGGRIVPDGGFAKGDRIDFLDGEYIIKGISKSKVRLTDPYTNRNKYVKLSEINKNASLTQPNKIIINNDLNIVGKNGELMDWGDIKPRSIVEYDFANGDEYIGEYNDDFISKMKADVTYRIDNDLPISGSVKPAVDASPSTTDDALKIVLRPGETNYHISIDDAILGRRVKLGNDEGVLGNVDASGKQVEVTFNNGTKGHILVNNSDIEVGNHSLRYNGYDVPVESLEDGTYRYYDANGDPHVGTAEELMPHIERDYPTPRETEPKADVNTDIDTNTNSSVEGGDQVDGTTEEPEMEWRPKGPTRENTGRVNLPKPKGFKNVKKMKGSMIYSVDYKGKTYRVYREEAGKTRFLDDSGETFTMTDELVKKSKDFSNEKYTEEFNFYGNGDLPDSNYNDELWGGIDQRAYTQASRWNKELITIFDRYSNLNDNVAWYNKVPWKTTIAGVIGAGTLAGGISTLVGGGGNSDNKNKNDSTQVFVDEVNGRVYTGNLVDSLKAELEKIRNSIGDTTKVNSSNTNNNLDSSDSTNMNTNIGVPSLSATNNPDIISAGDTVIDEDGSWYLKSKPGIRYFPK